MKNRRNGLHCVMKRSEIREKISSINSVQVLQRDYDAVCVEDLNLKGMAGGLHLGKGVHDNGYTCFCLC